MYLITYLRRTKKKNKRKNKNKTHLDFEHNYHFEPHD